MDLRDISVEIRNKTLTRVGQIRAEDLNFEIRPFFNDVGDWTLTLPAEHPMVPALRVPGSGIVVTARDAVYSGPTQSFTRKTTSSDPVGEFVFTGLLDDKILRERVALPAVHVGDPGVGTPDALPPFLRSHDVRRGPCETVMHGYVNYNIGPGAASAGRRHAALDLGPDLGRGKFITKSARFDTLSELLADIAAIGGLGFRVYQVGNRLEFNTYATANKTATVRLDVDNGTLASDEVSLQAPTATHVIVAGQGELEDRQLMEVSTPESRASVTQWGYRIERFLDQRHTDDLTELKDGGLEVLEKEGSQVLQVKAVPSDDGTMEFGREWFLGDRVTIVVEDQEYSDVVSGAVIKVNSNGVMVGVMIGSNDNDGEPLRKLNRRVSNLERNSSAAQNLEARIATLEALIN